MDALITNVERKFLPVAAMRVRNKLIHASIFCLLVISSGSIMTVQARTVEYAHSDALGTPVAVTNSAGQVIERSEYEPYGKLLNRPIADGPGFTGHVEDAATGLIYMQQRYYDPTIGRFLSVDPVFANASEGNGFNRYAYVLNNPYKFIDPDGRREKITGSNIVGSGGFAGSRLYSIGPPSIRSGDDAPRGSGSSSSAHSSSTASSSSIKYNAPAPRTVFANRHTCTSPLDIQISCH